MAEKHPPLSLTQELAQIDERLVSLLASRTELLSRAAISRRAKSLSITDPNQEKALWQVWRDSPKAEGLEPQMLRRYNMKTVIFDVDGVLLSEERYFDVSGLAL